MGVAITIRNVPDEVRSVLAARAAAAGWSLQEYLLRKLTADAAQPTTDEVIARARRRVKLAGSTITRDAIVDAVRSDRDDPAR